MHLTISGFRLKKKERMRYLYFFLAYTIFILTSDKQLLWNNNYTLLRKKEPCKLVNFSTWIQLQNENKL